MWGQATPTRFFGAGGVIWGPTEGYVPVTTLQSWPCRTGDVRLHAEFNQEGQRFAHDFTFRRERVD